MSLGAYAVTSYIAAALVVALLVAWIVTDYCNQKRRLSELEDSGVVRRSGRTAKEP